MDLAAKEFTRVFTVSVIHMEMVGKTRNLSDKTVDKREICLVAFCHANHYWPQKERCILCCLNFKKSVFVGSYTIFFSSKRTSRGCVSVHQ